MRTVQRESDLSENSLQIESPSLNNPNFVVFQVKPIQVNKWDGSAVKNALDDAVRDVRDKWYTVYEGRNFVNF